MAKDLLMYCFQASDPDSLPPPVAFSPPNAPPISERKKQLKMILKRSIFKISKNKKCVSFSCPKDPLGQKLGSLVKRCAL